MQSLFDNKATAAFRRRALARQTEGADFLLARAAEEMASRLSLVDRRFDLAAITSGNAGLIDPAFLAGTRHAQTRFADASADGKAWTETSEDHLSQDFAGLDLALSFMTLHETNDTPGALIQIRRALKQDGLFMAVFPAGNTLQELRESLIAAETELTGGAHARVYPFMDVRTAGSLLQRAGFALPVVDIETVTVRYKDMMTLVADLRSMGAANALAARPRSVAPKAMFAKAAAIYAERFAGKDGRIPATFEFVWMSGWAPSETQQKPARRGSASVSLATALENLEKKA